MHSFAFRKHPSSKMAESKIRLPKRMSESEEELDYEQAMRDFHFMFPSLDAEVIESVLRANHGAVDDTVDQLLLMTMDEPSAHETLPKTIDDKPAHGQQLYLPMRSSRPDANSFEAPTRPIQTFPEPDSVSPDMILRRDARHRQPDERTRFEGGKRPPTDTAKPKTVGGGQLAAVAKKVYKPPLLGKLPDDFLRLRPSRQMSLDQPLDLIYDDLQERKKKKLLASKSLSEAHGQQSSEAFRWSGRSPKKPHKGLEHANTLSGISARRRKQYGASERQAEHLKEVMLENQYRRHLVDDPELARYLEDERVAIMLQNREFMKQLRRNRDFLSALERDSLATTDQGGAVSKKIPDGPGVPPTAKPKKKKLSLRRNSGPPIPDGPLVDKSIANADLARDIDKPFEMIESPSRAETVIEGYGIDELEASGFSGDAFPYTKTVEKSQDEMDPAFLERVRHMGKSSKQKFALLARRFARKSKGAKGILSGSDSTYSGACLLDESDDSDVDTTRAAAVAAGYNQPVDEDYGIGDETALKSGRLFSK